MRSSIGPFTAILLTVPIALVGCGNTGLPTSPVSNPQGSTSIGTSGPIPSRTAGRSSQRRIPPPAPAGSAQRPTPPSLGGGSSGSGGATPPPNVGIGQPPAEQTGYDSRTEALLAQYRLKVRGKDATQQNVNIVTQGAQLYQSRRHTLNVVIQRDPSKLPVAGVWYTRGFGDATTELYQPQMPHVANHELAHDLTLLVDRSSGERFGDAIEANSNNPATFPSSYSRTQTPEAMAESLSFWAERVSRQNGSSLSYNPPEAVVAALQPFLSNELRSKR